MTVELTNDQQIKPCYALCAEKRKALYNRAPQKEKTRKGQTQGLPAVLYHEMYKGQHTGQSAGNQRDGNDCKHMSEFIS